MNKCKKSNKCQVKVEDVKFPKEEKKEAKKYLVFHAEDHKAPADYPFLDH